MKNTVKIIMTAMAAAVALPMMAQYTETGYFVDEYTYRYQMNPALGNAKGFVAIPALGNINATVQGNIGVTDVIYNVDGRTTTFMNPGVSATELMSNIKDVNRISADVSMPVLAFGFKGFGGYNTIGVNLRSSVATNIPRSLFSFLKEGISNQDYDIGEVGARANVYGEVALGHSHDITDELRIGATAKVLIGAGYIDANFEGAHLNLGTDNWNITSNARVDAYVKGLKYKTKINENSGNVYVNDVDIDNAGVNGFGFAVDLGVVYKPKALSDFTFSAALLDLGFINWSESHVASTGGVKTFNTNKYTFNVDDDAPNSFSKEFDRLKGDLSALYELEDHGEMGGATRSLAATTNVGVEYRLPVYDRMSFGLLNTTHIDGDYGWTDFRLSANWRACKVLSAAVSASTGTFGSSLGMMANLHCPGFNFFLGADKIATKVSKDHLPLTHGTSVNFGVNVLF